MQAGLIIVYASSGRTASLVAKYRPATPILVLVVPQLTSNTLSWAMRGQALARQCLIVRGMSATCARLRNCKLLCCVWVSLGPALLAVRLCTTAACSAQLEHRYMRLLC